MRTVSVVLAGLLGSLVGGCAATGGPKHSARGPAADPPTVTLPPEAVADTVAVKPPRIPAPLERPLPPAPYANLWDRIRAGFELPEAERRAVRQNREYFSERPAYMDRVSERAGPWMHHIVEALEARDMPLELALLPVVESAFRPFAYSHGRAAGLWQFVPATGRHFGLEQNWWYDGRRDVIAATDAALSYLERLHGMFDGDWLLAIAAYNAGEGNVLAAVRENRRAGQPTDFWSLDLPRETEGYVPRLLALRDLVAAPAQYGLTDGIPPIPNEPGIAVVEMDHQIDLALAAELAGISIEQLYRLNPGYNRWATAPKGPHRLVLPPAAESRFRQRLAQTPPRERMRWQRHEVGPGETLLAIADDYHTTVSAIRRTNDIRGNLIREGQDLIVPVASRPEGEYVLSASQRLEDIQSREREGQRVSHTVRAGDTFWGLARRHDVGVRELAKWNGMAPGDPLRPGQELVIWTDGAAGAVARSGPQQGRMQSVRYTVREGDSLYRIARRFKVSVNDLRRWNDLSRGRYLQPGQTLRMKVDVTRQSDS